jgi:hypothetical protein
MCVPLFFFPLHFCVLITRIWWFLFFLKKKQTNSNDIEWDGESKRIIAVGDGREK